MILFTMVAILFILAFTIPYLLWIWHAPSSMTFLLSVIFMPLCILLALVTMSFMKSVPIGDFWGGFGWYPQEPTTLSGLLADLHYYYGKYKKCILFGAAANAFYFICLAGYFLLAGQGMNRELSSERTGVFIFSFWVIINGLIVIASCLSLYFQELNQE